MEKHYSLRAASRHPGSGRASDALLTRVAHPSRPPTSLCRPAFTSLRSLFCGGQGFRRALYGFGAARATRYSVDVTFALSVVCERRCGGAEACGDRWRERGKLRRVAGGSVRRAEPGWRERGAAPAMRCSFPRSCQRATTPAVAASERARARRSAPVRLPASTLPLDSAERTKSVSLAASALRAASAIPAALALRAAWETGSATGWPAERMVG